jgi:hypothetical protein
VRVEEPAPTPPDGFWRRLAKRLRTWFSGPAPRADLPPQRRSEYEPSPRYDDVDLENPDQLKRASRAYDLKLDDEFRRRIAEPVRVSRLRLTAVDFFGDTEWELHPRVNILLGANGYGKSLILRTLAGMLQRDEAVTESVIVGAGPDARIRLDIVRGGYEERIQRDAEIFLRGAPRVPLLAIPDARFTDRSTRAAPDPNAENLAFDGARQFLDQTPYQSTIDSLLATLGIEYRLHGESFDIDSFRLLSRVLHDLTSNQFAFDHVELQGRIGSDIFVRTEGIDRPLPIKQASQGTLSVVAMFGIIQAFLRDVAGEGGNEDEPHAIVIIDEVDAHLHPSWQQRIRGLLVDYFPTVQFILSAHSPLAVAGCGPGEVAVLRKREGGGSFCIEQVSGDFVGATSPDLLQRLFEIEDRDPEFRRYANKADRGEREAMRQRTDKLFAKQRDVGLDDEEATELKRLVGEANTISRVAEVLDAERQESMRALDLEVQIAQLQRRVAELEAEASEPEVA